MTETSGTSATARREYSFARSIVVFGNYGNGNLGDEATLQALIGLLRSRIPEVRLLALAVNPVDTASRHRIPVEPASRLAARAPRIVAGAPVAISAHPRIKGALARAPRLFGLARGTRRLLSALGRVVRDPLFEVRQLRTLRGADCVVIGGGGQLSEPVAFFESLPMRVLKLTLLAKLVGTPVLILNIGVIPLERRSTRLLVRSALRLADYRSVRDDASRSLALQIGAPAPEVQPDLAYALDRLDAAEPQPRRTVAINVFPHFDGRYLPISDGRYERYLDTLSAFTLGLLVQGWSVVLVMTQVRADPPALADFRARLAAAPGWNALERQVQQRRISSVADLLEALGSSDLVIATRYHAAVLGFALCRPVLALAAHPKVAEEMTAMGQESFLFAIDAAKPEAMLSAFERLDAEREAVGAELARRASAKREQLAREFDQLFGPARA